MRITRRLLFYLQDHQSPMKLTTTTLLPFAPHQEQISSPYSSQRALVQSRLPSLFSNSLPCTMSTPSLNRRIDVPLRPNSLRNRPSVISKSSYESSSSSSSSSFPDTSPTSYSTPPSSLPPSPPPPSYVFIIYFSNPGNLTVACVNASRSRSFSILVIT